MADQISSLKLALNNHDEPPVHHHGSPRILDNNPFSFDAPTDVVTNRCRMDAKLRVNGFSNGNNLIPTSYHNYHHHHHLSDSMDPTEEDFSDLEIKFQELQPLLSNKDKTIRRQGINSLNKAILTMVSSGYDKDDSTNNHNTSSTDIFGSEPRQIFNQALAYLLRLKMRCPFADVREESKKILQDLDKRGVRILKPINEEISSFIPTHQILPADGDGEHPTLSLYTESFVDNCRLEHMVMVMGMHPTYLEIFLKTNTLLLKAKGSLSKRQLCYIAIMAASRHKCSYLVHLMEQQFINEGGDRSWLRGVQNVPKKLRNLSTLNKFLAHAPWRVTSDLIKDLMECRSREERWQPGDLLQVIILISHFQSLATFCHGTGINLELDHESGLTYDESQERLDQGMLDADVENRFFNPQPDSNADVEELMSRMKKFDEIEEFSLSENKERFASAKQEAFLLPEAEEDTTSSKDEYLSRYLEDPEFSFQDEVGKEEIFRAQDYNWEDNVSHVVNQLYSDEVADLLDDKFRITNDLTYKTLATKNDVDTTSLRRGIWMYVQILYNIRYDDYNYGVLSGSDNSLLERPLKAFIKTITCYPEKVTKEKYDSFWQQFKHSEKVHVMIMAKEAKLQVGLMYGVKAFNEYYYVKR